MRRLLRAVLITASWLIVWLFATSQPAFAHAELLGTTPGNGEHLAVAPPEVQLRFSESVNPVRGGFSLLNSQGKRIGDTEAVSVAGDSSKVRLPITQTLPDGVYSLSWRVVSADSHPIHGALVFSVGNAQAAPLAGAGAQSGADPVVGAAFWVSRWLGFAAVALLLGGGFFVVTCWPAGLADRRFRRVLRIGWWTAACSSLAVLLLQGANSAGTSILSVFDPTLVADTVSSGFGILLLVRLALLVAFSRVDLGRRNGAVLAAVLAVALVVTWSASGHAVAGDLVPLALLTDVSHLLAMSVWLGGLVVLVACVVWPGRKTTAAETAAVLSRFSRAALIAVAVLAGTGVFMALREVGLAGLLSGSQYVTLVLFKIGAFGLLLWLAAMSRAAVQRQLAQPGRKTQTEAIVRLRRSVWSEAGIAIAVLGLTAALVSTPPTELDADVARTAAPAGPFLSALALQGSGDVQVWLSPARIGDNQVVVNVRDERGINRDVPEVTAQLTLSSAGIGPMPVALAKTAPGQFVAQRVTVPSQGTWQLAVRVRTSELDVTTVDASVPVN